MLVSTTLTSEFQSKYISLGDIAQSNINLMYILKNETYFCFVYDYRYLERT